eukprot:2198316-Pleurochrysis_carterae.AAC.1
MAGESAGPSAMRPPSTAVRVCGAPPASGRCCPLAIASASASFRAGGYAAAAVARARPCASRPCATAVWPATPCVHTARRSSPT